jgi:hypothetical protein
VSVRARRGGALVLALASCALLVACRATSEVDRIVAAHVEARGGLEAIRAMHSMRATGTVTGPGGRTARIVRETSRPGRIRVELTYQGVTGIWAHDGERGWRVAPLEGSFEPTPMPAEASAAAADQLDLDGPLVGWREKGQTVELVGIERVGERELHRLRVRLPDGSTREHWLDAVTHDLVRTDSTREFRGRKVRLETTFSDYRSVDGLRLPHLIESRAAGRPASLRIRVERVELDPVIDDARYRMPAGAGSS